VVIEEATHRRNPYDYKVRTEIATGMDGQAHQNFLPSPDLEKPNPHYLSGPPMLLFSLARIEAIEKTEEFKAHKEIAAKRKEAAKKSPS
jgi:hypothetical protein